MICYQLIRKSVPFMHMVNTTSVGVGIVERWINTSHPCPGNHKDQIRVIKKKITSNSITHMAFHFSFRWQLVGRGEWRLGWGGGEGGKKLNDLRKAEIRTTKFKVKHEKLYQTNSRHKSWNKTYLWVFLGVSLFLQSHYPIVGGRKAWEQSMKTHTHTYIYSFFFSSDSMVHFFYSWKSTEPILNICPLHDLAHPFIKPYHSFLCPVHYLCFISVVVICVVF